MADPAVPRGEFDITHRTLKERAQALARPLVPEEPADTVELVVMVVGTERYGVDTRHVNEILPLADLAPVPGTPAFWSGIINVRGTLYPVLDLRRYLSLADEGIADGPGTVALVAAAGLTVGILVDEVPGVARVPAAGIRPLVLAGAPETDRTSMHGVTDDLLTVVDLDALLGDSKLAVRERPI